MTRRNLFDIYNVLVSLDTVKASAKFHYLRIVNTRAIKQEYEAYQAAFKTPDSYSMYIDLRNQAILEEAKRDGSGNIIWEIQGELPVFEDVAELKKRLVELDSSNAQVIYEFSKLKAEMELFLDEPVEFEVHKIPLDICPDMDGKTFETILPLIQD